MSALFRFQLQLYDLLEAKSRQRTAGLFINGLLAAVIAFNIVAFVLQTVESIQRDYAVLFDWVLYFSIALFTVEYLLRVWVCIRHESGLYSHPLKGRLRYMFSPMALVDLAAILPFYIGVIAGMDLRFLRLIRLLWILKVSRYLPALGYLGRVLKRERRTLIAVIALMFVMLFMASSFIYLLENQEQPEKFASIPHAMWWGVATLTTVGYGDLVPVTPMGKALGMLIMLLGIGTFALPAGILASAFAEERKRRDFILSWNLVAQVPCFASLNATEIARIAALLHPREAMANEVIFRKGDEAENMYFIVAGEVEVELPEPVRYSKGEFFGEIALLFHLRRTATVVAVQHTELLELDAQELHRVLDDNPELKAYILAVAEKRYDDAPQGRDVSGLRGDYPEPGSANGRYF